MGRWSWGSVGASATARRGRRLQATFLVLARKAASISKGESVGGWLYRVAYHAAVRARKQAAVRQEREERALPAPVADALDEVTGRELMGVLDEELARLPQRYRAPLVLCYLEGKTRDEAAQQLRCPLGTLKHRLEEARSCLRSRLERRGLGMPAALLAAGVATASVPAHSLRRRRGRHSRQPRRRALSWCRRKPGRGDSPGAHRRSPEGHCGGLLAAGLLIASAGLFGSDRPPTNKASAETKSLSRNKPRRREKATEKWAVAGQVRDADEPVSGIGLPSSGKLKHPIAVVSDTASMKLWTLQDGQRGSVPPRLFRRCGRRTRARQVIASAPGHGLEWVRPAARRTRQTSWSNYPSSR
jgi:RNA polymerase sigma factor (sigma-70 family)